MKPFKRENRNDKYSRLATYAVHGFWSGDNVRVYQSRNYKDGKWEQAHINWSCGGRDPEKEPDDIVAVKCFGKTIMNAVKVASRWNKDTV